MMLWRTDYERILFARNINFAMLRIVFSEEEEFLTFESFANVLVILDVLSSTIGKFWTD